ncbi:hypothetical protein ACH4YO_19060 [Streptomyces noursei]|uniref:hypothetical protein n=1 Tax=Streptomyces noursei TaxID=1971 RepID=UPI0033CF115E
MSNPNRYSENPVELPLDGWLVEGHPVRGCKPCAASHNKRDQALKRNDWRAAGAAAADIRSHKQSH